MTLLKEKMQQAPDKERPLSVPKAMDGIVRNLLHDLESEGKEILFACESGSRAWNVHSQDSDYDVRGVYVRDNIREYVSFGKDREGVRELEFEITPPKAAQLFDGHGMASNTVGAELDVVLWDVWKYLHLLGNGNATAREWAESPVQYVETRWKRTLNSLTERFYNPKSYAHHYIGLAQNNYKRYVKDQEEVERKKLIYITRALCQAERILQNPNERVETCFNMDTITQMIKEEGARESFRTLVGKKRMGLELGTTGLDDRLVQWIEVELHDGHERCEEMDAPYPETTEVANHLLHQALRL